MGPPPGAFIREDFLLTTPPACRLYHQFAEAEPFSTTTVILRRRMSRSTGSFKNWIGNPAGCRRRHGHQLFECAYLCHEYFWRTLCNLISCNMVKGLLPDNDGLVGPMTKKSVTRMPNISWCLRMWMRPHPRKKSGRGIRGGGQDPFTASRRKHA